MIHSELYLNYVISVCPTTACRGPQCNFVFPEPTCKLSTVDELGGSLASQSDQSFMCYSNHSYFILLKSYNILTQMKFGQIASNCSK